MKTIKLLALFSALSLLTFCEKDTDTNSSTIENEKYLVKQYIVLKLFLLTATIAQTTLSP